MRAGPLQMRAANGSHDSDLRTRDLGQDRDVAGLVHAHFEDRHLVAGASRSNVSGNPISLFSLAVLRSTCQRAARTSAICSLVDVLARDPVTPTTSGENGRAMRRRPAQGEERVVNPDHRDVAEAAEIDLLRHNERGRAASSRIRHEAMAVGSLAGEREKCVARLDATRIDGTAAYRRAHLGAARAPDCRCEHSESNDWIRPRARGQPRRATFALISYQCRTSPAASARHRPVAVVSARLLGRALDRAAGLAWASGR